MADNKQPLQKQVIFNGGNAAVWDTGRDAVRLSAEYKKNVIEPQAQAIRWSFSPKTTSFADIFYIPNINRPFEQLVINLKNLGSAVSISAKLVDHFGAEYVVPQQSVAQSNEWQSISFAFDDFAVGSWSKDEDGQIDYPIKQIAVIAYNIEVGKDYQLDIAEIAVLRKPAVRMIALMKPVPRSVTAGQKIVLQGTIVPKTDYDNKMTCELQLMRGNQMTARCAIKLPENFKAGQKLQIGPVELRIPLFSWGGEHYIRCSIGYSEVVNAAGSEQIVKLHVQPRHVGKSVATVEPYKGVPTLHINGQPNAAMSYMSYNPNTKYYTQFGNAGVHIFTFSATPTEAGYTLSKETWTAPNKWDYSQTDERSMMVMSSDEHAYFFPRLYLRAPKWWTDSHPDELVTYDPGDGKPIPFLHSEGRRVPSWASEVWRKDTAMAIQRYIRHMEQSPWADRLIGYHIASGTTEEWMMWGGNDDQWVDYSKPNREAFHRWLKAKYSSIDALRTAWQNTNVTFDTAAIPTKKQRAASTFDSLRDPSSEQQVIDYYLYNSDLVVDTIAYFAQVVKQATRNEKLVGAFYGYVLQLAADQRQQNAGHLSIKKLLECPHVDFITSPTSYAFRAPGTGYTHFMSLSDSVKAHGKLWMDENDYKTWLSPGLIGDWGKTATCEESIQQQQREFGCVMGHSCGKWWFDMGGGWFDDPKMMKAIGNMAGIADKSLAWDRSPADEIALIVDPHSLAWMRTGNEFSGALIMQQLPLLVKLDWSPSTRMALPSCTVTQTPHSTSKRKPAALPSSLDDEWSEF